MLAVADPAPLEPLPWPQAKLKADELLAQLSVPEKFSLLRGIGYEFYILKKWWWNRAEPSAPGVATWTPKMAAFVSSEVLFFLCPSSMYDILFLNM